jgi:hypothetical protein
LYYSGLLPIKKPFIALEIEIRTLPKSASLQQVRVLLSNDLRLGIANEPKKEWPPRRVLTDTGPAAERLSEFLASHPHHLLELPQFLYPIADSPLS